MESINAKYVSQKISKTRWKPVSHSTLQQPEIFATGSWDNEENKISLWSIGNHENVAMDDGNEGDPQVLCEHKHDGDVLDLQTLSVSQHWARAHRYPCDSAPCTSVVCSSPEIVTVGEDGRIVVFRADHEGVVQTIENADSSTIHAVTYLRTTEILTVNSIGQLKMWDLRQHSKSPSQIFSLSGDRVPLHCVDRHPNQQHIVATGGQDGMLCVWDVRQGNSPFSLMEAHSAEMWEVHFHPTNPDHMFTCSEDGSLLHWETSSQSDLPSFLQGNRNNSMISRSAMPSAGGNQSIISAWLSGDSSKSRLETTHMLPSQTLSVNSLDVLGHYLVCGTDGEAIFVHRQIPV
uniref:Nucleoporin 43 n=1 Tax=Cynoglossus semilaevis TaxID=244447 RepID=A0A3P8UPX7_CYNSE